MKKTITIDGTEYVPKGSVKSEKELAKKYKGLDYVIVRSHSAGVFAGYLKKREGKECVMLKSRRLWYWDGAASLSQLSVDGVSKPDKCKFPCEIEGEHVVTEAEEILPCTDKAQLSINNVPIWQK